MQLGSDSDSEEIVVQQKEQTSTEPPRERPEVFEEEDGAEWCEFVQDKEPRTSKPIIPKAPTSEPEMVSMTADKAATIKNAMSKLKLKAPVWAEKLPEDVWLTKMFQAGPK